MCPPCGSRSRAGSAARRHRAVDRRRLAHRSSAASPLAVKRLARPAPHDPRRAQRPGALRLLAARGRRALESGREPAHPGLRGAVAAVEEDADGITITPTGSRTPATNGLFVAHALGRFAGASLGRPVPGSRATCCADRLARVERRGGWPTLARTSARRRRRPACGPAASDFLEPVRRPAAGRRTTATSRRPTSAGRDGDRVRRHRLGDARGRSGRHRPRAPRWPAREELEPLLDAYLMGLPTPAARHRRARCCSAPGSRPSTPPSAGPSGRWSGSRAARARWPRKFRHPRVAPHLRALQRQSPLIEALLEL